jgi:hypothetical protein
MKDPAIIYHHTSAEGLFGVFDKRRLWTIAPNHQLDVAEDGLRCFLNSKGLDIPICKSRVPLRY